MTTMSKQTRRNFLAVTTASVVGLPLMKAFPSATGESPQAKSPVGPVSVHITAGNQRYAPSGSLAWQSINRAPAADTILLRATHSKKPILGFGAALTDAA